MRRTPIICWLVVVLTLIVQLASAQPQENPRPPEEEEPRAAVPALADIVPLEDRLIIEAHLDI